MPPGRGPSSSRLVNTHITCRSKLIVFRGWMRCRSTESLRFTTYWRREVIRGRLQRLSWMHRVAVWFGFKLRFCFHAAQILRSHIVSSACLTLFLLSLLSQVWCQGCQSQGGWDYKLELTHPWESHLLSSGEGSTHPILGRVSSQGSSRTAWGAGPKPPS